MITETVQQSKSEGLKVMKSGYTFIICTYHCIKNLTNRISEIKQHTANTVACLINLRNCTGDQNI